VIQYVLRLSLTTLFISHPSTNLLRHHLNLCLIFSSSAAAFNFFLDWWVFVCLFLSFSFYRFSLPWLFFSDSIQFNSIQFNSFVHSSIRPFVNSSIRPFVHSLLISRPHLSYHLRQDLHSTFPKVADSSTAAQQHRSQERLQHSHRLGD
jgi:hypothetical protein